MSRPRTRHSLRLEVQVKGEVTSPPSLADSSERALSIVEIQAMIFDCFVEDEPEPCSEATLAACAIVCRAWRIPAQRSLWRNLSSLLPLLKLLGEIEIVDTVAVFAGLLRSHSWSRFVALSSYVRQVVIYVTDGSEASKRHQIPIHPTTIHDAVTFCASMDAPLLPAAHYLKFIREGPTTSFDLVHLIPKTLQTVIINGNFTSQDLASAFRRLCLCRDLWSINVRLDLFIADAQIDMLVPNLLDLLSNSRSLKEIGLNEQLLLHPNIWAALSRLPQLQTVYDVFEYTLRKKGVFMPHRELFLHPGFQKLIHLELELNRCSALALLRYQGTLALTELKLHLSVIAPNTTTPKEASMFKQINDTCPLLTTLAIIYEAPNRIASAQRLLALKSLGLLQSLTVHSASTAPLIDNDWKLIGAQHPKLRFLSISPAPVIHLTPPQTTLMALPILAKACPDLRHLEIHLGLPTDSIPPIATIQTPFTQLETINFGLSTPIDPCPLDLALFLDALCGGKTVKIVSELDTHNWKGDGVSQDYSGTARGWRKTGEAVAAIRAAMDGIRQENMTLRQRVAEFEGEL